MFRPVSPLRVSWLSVALIVGVVALCYANSLWGPLVLDDLDTITGNASIRQLWPPWPALAPPNNAGIGGRPFANLTFALSYALGGADVRAFHLGNVVVHALAALTLFALVRRTLLLPPLRARCGDAATPLALAVALVWAAHPLASAVVDYISQRTEALMALFYLLTLLGFVRWTECLAANQPRRADAWLVATAVAAALGMASKEVMVTAPVLVLLYDRTFVAGSWREAWRRHRHAHLVLAGTWLLLASLILSTQIGDRGVGFDQNISPWTYLVSESVALVRYLRLAIWPSPLVFDYGWAFAPGLAAVLPQALACVALVAATIVALVRRPVLGFVGAWFLVVLAPTSSFVPISQQPIAESRMYLPLAGLVAGGVVGLFLLLRGRALVLAALATLAGGGVTVQRNLDYRTVLGLWTDTTTKVPDNARAHCNRGVTFFLENRPREAVDEFEIALRIRPGYPDAHSNLAALLIRDDRPAEALAHADAALQVDPSYLNAHYNRGNALALLHRSDEAIASLETVLRLNPRHASAHSDLAMIHLDAGRVAPALLHAEAAVRLDPRLAVAQLNLGNALSRAGRIRESIDHFRTALRLDPTLAKAEHNLAVALLNTGDRLGAIEHFEAALRLRPDYPEAKRNLEIVRGTPK